MDTKDLDRGVWQIAQQLSLPHAVQGLYNKDSGQGIPSDAVWKAKTLRKSDGLQFCSGAVWWLLVDLLRLAGLESLEAVTPELLEDLRKWAWVWEDEKHHGGLPQGLVEHGLGVLHCNGEASPDPSLFVQGRFFQYWSSWSGNIGYKGHTGIIAEDADATSGFFVEWSSSPLLRLSPDKKSQDIGKKKWFIASLHPDISGLLVDRARNVWGIL